MDSRHFECKKFFKRINFIIAPSLSLLIWNSKCAFNTHYAICFLMGADLYLSFIYLFLKTSFSQLLIFTDCSAAHAQCILTDYPRLCFFALQGKYSINSTAI